MDFAVCACRFAWKMRVRVCNDVRLFTLEIRNTNQLVSMIREDDKYRTHSNYFLITDNDGKRVVFLCFRLLLLDVGTLKGWFLMFSDMFMPFKIHRANDFRSYECSNSVNVLCRQESLSNHFVYISISLEMT